MSLELAISMVRNESDLQIRQLIDALSKADVAKDCDESASHVDAERLLPP